MNMDLKNIAWGEFEIGVEFDVKNSKTYHKSDLKEVKNNGISYVSRTNLNNGIESVVKDDDFKVNKNPGPNYFSSSSICRAHPNTINYIRGIYN